MRRPGCFPGAWSSWHLQVVSLHLKWWTSLSVSFAFCSILPRKRAPQAAEAARGGKRLVYTNTVRLLYVRADMPVLRERNNTITPTMIESPLTSAAPS